LPVVSKLPQRAKPINRTVRMMLVARADKCAFHTSIPGIGRRNVHRASRLSRIPHVISKATTSSTIAAGGGFANGTLATPTVDQYYNFLRSLFCSSCSTQGSSLTTPVPTATSTDNNITDNNTAASNTQDTSTPVVASK
jgi:hypothetical protein